MATETASFGAGKRESHDATAFYGRRLLAHVADPVSGDSYTLDPARRVAERFNELPPGAVQQTKRLMRAARRQPALDAIAAEGEVFGERLRSPEAMEAFQAFFQKRKPDFKHR